MRQRQLPPHAGMCASLRDGLFAFPFPYSSTRTDDPSWIPGHNDRSFNIAGDHGAD